MANIFNDVEDNSMSEEEEVKEIAPPVFKMSNGPKVYQNPAKTVPTAVTPIATVGFKFRKDQSVV